MNFRYLIFDINASTSGLFKFCDDNFVKEIKKVMPRNINEIEIKFNLR